MISPWLTKILTTLIEEEMVNTGRVCNNKGITRRDLRDEGKAGRT